jgi:hypothetical protein
MSSTQEFSESWQRLSVAELEAIGAVTASPQASKASPAMVDFLTKALQSEVDHRQDFKTKADQTPPLATWTNSQVASSYFAAVMLERALAGTSERLGEWAALLKNCVCLEMASRLKASDLILVQAEGDPRCN